MTAAAAGCEGRFSLRVDRMAAGSYYGHSIQSTDDIDNNNNNYESKTMNPAQGKQESSRPESTASSMSESPFNSTIELDCSVTYASVVSKAASCVESESTSNATTDLNDDEEEKEHTCAKSGPSMSSCPQEGVNGSENNNVHNETVDGILNGHLQEESSLRRGWREGDQSTTHHPSEPVYNSEAPNSCPLMHNFSNFHYTSGQERSGYSLAPSETARYTLTSPNPGLHSGRFRSTINHMNNRLYSADARPIRGSNSRQMQRSFSSPHRKVNTGPIYPFPNSGECGSSFIPTLPCHPVDRTHELITRQQQANLNLNAAVYTDQQQQQMSYINNHSNFHHPPSITYLQRANFYTSPPPIYRQPAYFAQNTAFLRPPLMVQAIDTTMATIYPAPAPNFTSPLSTHPLPVTADQIYFAAGYSPVQPNYQTELNETIEAIEDFEEKQRESERVQSCVIAALRMANLGRSTDLAQLG